MGIHAEFPEKRRASRTWEAEVAPETEFKRDVFYKIIDSVISGLTTRFKAIEELDKTFATSYGSIVISPITRKLLQHVDASLPDIGMLFQ